MRPFQKKVQGEISQGCITVFILRSDSKAQYVSGKTATLNLIKIKSFSCVNNLGKGWEGHPLPVAPPRAVCTAKGWYAGCTAIPEAPCCGHDPVRTRRRDGTLGGGPPGAVSAGKGIVGLGEVKTGSCKNISVWAQRRGSHNDAVRTENSGLHARDVDTGLPTWPPGTQRHSLRGHVWPVWPAAQQLCSGETDTHPR